MTINIDYLCDIDLLDQSYLAALEALLDGMLEEYDLQQGEVSLVIGTDELLHRLNREYRNQDRPTDVLSFSYLEPGEAAPADGREFAVGDIYISLEKASAQAAEAEHSIRQETALLAIHGMLHLLGFDHLADDETDQMRSRELYYLKQINLETEGA
jgi:probable rRNA maturation factor